MSATQILWVNLILSATLGLVLAFEPTEPGIMGRTLRANDAALLSPFLLWRVVVVVSVLLGRVSLAVFFYALGQGRQIEFARTMVVNSKHTPRTAAKLNQAARATRAACQFQGSNSSIRLTGWSAMRARASASHAWGSTSLRRQVWISE
jgi:magnesium-transporting ATPase (P-type)